MNGSFITVDLEKKLTSSAKAWSSSPHLYDTFLLLAAIVLRWHWGEFKFRCGICHRPVRVNQARVQCDLCDFWVHKQCVNMLNYEYERLQLSDEPWCCLPYLKEALLFHNCSTISSCNSFSSLPQPPTSPHNGGIDTALSPNPSQLSLLCSNCRSLVPKLENLHVHANSLNTCIIALTETWLDATLCNHEHCIPGYSVIQRDRNLVFSFMSGVIYQFSQPLITTLLNYILRTFAYAKATCSLVFFITLRLFLCQLLMTWIPLSQTSTPQD